MSEQAMPCPSQKIFDEGCYFGRHLLAKVVATAAEQRAEARMRATAGSTEAMARMAGMHARSEAFNDHLQSTADVAPRMYKP